MRVSPIPSNHTIYQHIYVQFTDSNMKLNDFLQMRRMGNTLSWRESTSGPQHAALWTVTALSAQCVPCAILVLLRVECGCGCKKEAARQVLDALMDPA